MVRQCKIYVDATDHQSYRLLSDRFTSCDCDGISRNHVSLLEEVKTSIL